MQKLVSLPSNAGKRDSTLVLTLARRGEGRSGTSSRLELHISGPDSGIFPQLGTIVATEEGKKPAEQLVPGL